MRFRSSAGMSKTAISCIETIEGQEIVLHLAALIAIPYSYEAPRSYVRSQCRGHAERPGGRAALQCRPSGAYQHVGGLRHRAAACRSTKTHPLQGQSPYSASKIARRQACRELLSLVRRLRS